MLFSSCFGKPRTAGYDIMIHASPSKVLVMGADGSGKTTILRNLTDIPEDADASELQHRARDSFMTDLDAIAGVTGFDFVELVGGAESASREGAELSPDQRARVAELFQDEEIRMLALRQGQGTAFSNVDFWRTRMDSHLFSEKVPRFTKEEKVRVKETSASGLKEYAAKGKMGGLSGQTCFVDVPGSFRLDRDFVLEYSQNLKGMIYVVDLDKYDAPGAFDSDFKAVQQLFSCLDSHELMEIPVVIFLNKLDLFLEKIKQVSFKEHHPTYEGADGDGAAIKLFLESSFQALFPRDRLESQDQNTMYPTYFQYFSSSTDLNQSEQIFNAVKWTFYGKKLADTGFL